MTCHPPLASLHKVTLGWGLMQSEPAPGERDTELSRSHLENGQEPENHVCQHLALRGFPGIPDSKNMLESCLIQCTYMEVEVGVTHAKPRLP